MSNIIENDYDWVFLMYINGNNSLEVNALEDYVEMASSYNLRNNKKIKVIVQLSRLKSGDGNTEKYGNWSGIKRFELDKHLKPIDYIGNNSVMTIKGDMTTPKTLTDFISWGVTNFSSNHYALVFWDHGNFTKSKNFSNSNFKKNDIDIIYNEFELYYNESQNRIHDLEKSYLTNYNKEINSSYTAFYAKMSSTNKMVDKINNRTDTRVLLPYLTWQNITSQPFDTIYYPYKKTDKDYNQLISAQDFLFNKKGILETAKKENKAIISFFDTIKKTPKISRESFEKMIIEQSTQSNYINSFQALTEKKSKSSMSALDVTTISKNVNHKNSKIDLIFFDSCTMGNIEMVAQFIDNLNIQRIIASQVEVKGKGLNYKHFFNSIKSSTKVQEMSDLIVKSFESEYKGYTQRNATLASYNPKKMKELTKAINLWIKRFMDHKNDTIYRNALIDTRKFSFLLEQKESVDLYLFMDAFSKELKNNCSKEECKELINNSLEICRLIKEGSDNFITKVFSNNEDYYKGVSIYFPEKGRAAYIKNYKNIDIYQFASLTNWYTIIEYYRKYVSN